jgi:hypothetical protein
MSMLGLLLLPIGYLVDYIGQHYEFNYTIRCQQAQLSGTNFHIASVELAGTADAQFRLPAATRCSVQEFGYDRIIQSHYAPEAANWL